MLSAKSAIAFCFSTGNPRSCNAGRLCQPFQELVSMQGHTLKMVVVADRDYHPDIPQLREPLPNQHIQWHVWDRVEIENYLLPESAIRRLVSSRGNDFALGEGRFAWSSIESSRNLAFEHSIDRSRRSRTSEKNAGKRGTPPTALAEPGNFSTKNGNRKNWR